MWDGQIAAFKDRYRILVYDTRGHAAARRRRGRTRGAAGGGSARIMKKLQIARTHFVGLSMGGMIGQNRGAEGPRALRAPVLADTGHTQTPRNHRAMAGAHPCCETKGMQPLVDATLARWFTEPFRKEQA